jgi:hypothetical protein
VFGTPAAMREGIEHWSISMGGTVRGEEKKEKCEKGKKQESKKTQYLQKVVI